MEANRDAAARWPASVLYPRLRAALVDGLLNVEEEADLFETMMEITGGGVTPRSDIASLSSWLPVDKPPPPIVFPDRLFCLTGKFVFGTRAQCELEVVHRGGKAQANPTLNTHFLVIGAIGSRDWKHSTHGNKIQTAVEMRDRGRSIAIISEEYWTEVLNQ